MRPRLGMAGQEVMQHVEQPSNVPLVAVALRASDVIDDDVAQQFHSMRLLHQERAQRRRGDRGQVLVLRDCEAPRPR
jgi:hypothetical protein